jgi:hypothetical protein
MRTQIVVRLSVSVDGSPHGDALFSLGLFVGVVTIVTIAVAVRAAS